MSLDQPRIPEEIDTAWSEATAMAQLDDWRVLSTLCSRYDIPPTRIIRGAMGVAQFAVNQGRWVRRFNGERAVILPYGFGDDLIDLIAFRPETPRSSWTMTGACQYLGQDALDWANMVHEPVVFFETVPEWLAADEQGVVVLDWETFWPFHLANVPAIRCATVEFGRRVKALLERPFPVPQIEVAA